MAFKFSANTGYLWKELPFIDRIRAAFENGFDAVEFHDEPQKANLQDLKSILDETGLPVVGLNARMGETVGCAAIPGMADLARRDIMAAIDLAAEIGAPTVHVLSGKTNALGAEECYLETLRYALDASDLTILIEPICLEKMPGYFMHNLNKALDVVGKINHPRLKIMFDCFHIEQEHGDVLGQFERSAAHIGHVQIASFPNRNEPVTSRLDYTQLLPAFRERGYVGAYGCEYIPASTVEAGLGWRDVFKDL
jgi:2-dehydrotetronate isomerase